MSLLTTGRVTIAMVMLITASVPLPAQRSTMTPDEQQNLQFVLDWWREVLEARHLDLAPQYMAQDYIQHNINVQTGRDGFVGFFSALGPPVEPMPTGLAIPPVISFAKGDFVLLVFERDTEDAAEPSRTYTYNTYDLLRMEDGLIQEHWDYAEKVRQIPMGGAPDGIDYSAVGFDLTRQEQRNVEIATVLFKDVLQYGHLELAEQAMAPGFIQHNPRSENGRQAFVDWAARIDVSPVRGRRGQFFARFSEPEPIEPEWKDRPEITIASGPYVFFMFKQEWQDPDDSSRTYPVYWFDMVRVENGLIQEHWDSATLSALPGQGGR